MKRPITPSYTFTPGSGTLNLSGIAGFDIRNLFAVIDLKTGALIYAPLAGYGYSALSGTTLTLQAAMTGLAAADPLLILYDDGGKPAEDGTDVAGAAMPAGGAGIRGWLSGIYKAITGGAPNAPRVASTGALAATNDAITVACDGMNTAVVQLLAASAWTAGTVIFEGSMDGGGSYFAVSLVPYGGAAAVGAVSGGAAATPQAFEMACGGLTHLRARATGAITGGPLTAIVAATNGLKSLRVGAPAGNPVPTQPPATPLTAASALSCSATAGAPLSVVPYSASRKWLVVYNRSAGTETVDLGPAGVAPGGGIPLAPGAGFLFAGTGAAGPIYAASPVAGTPLSFVEA